MASGSPSKYKSPSGSPSKCNSLLASPFKRDSQQRSPAKGIGSPNLEACGVARSPIKKNGRKVVGLKSLDGIVLATKKRSVVGDKIVAVGDFGVARIGDLDVAKLEEKLKGHVLQTNGVADAIGRLVREAREDDASVRGMALLAGFDDVTGPRLFFIDPSGIVSERTHICIDTDGSQTFDGKSVMPTTNQAVTSALSEFEIILSQMEVVAVTKIGGKVEIKRYTKQDVMALM